MYYPDGDQDKRPRHARTARRRFGLIIGLVVAAVVVIATGGVLVGTGTVSSWLHPVADYSSEGTRTVDFTIAEGDIGEDIAKNLASAGVTKSFLSLIHI